MFLNEIITPNLKRIKDQKFVNDLFGDSLYYYFDSFNSQKNIVVVRDEQSAQDMSYKLKHILNKEKVLIFHEWDKLFFDGTIPSGELEGKRIRTLYELLSRDSFFLIVSFKAFYQKILHPDLLKSASLTLNMNGLAPTSTIGRKLTQLGFEREDMVEEPGKYSLRGEVIDIWPYGHKKPFRINTGFDEIESIKTIDPDTNRSEDNRVESLTVLPCREIFALDKNAPDHKDTPLEELYDDYPHFYEKYSSILDYTGKANLFFLEQDLINEKLNTLIEELEDYHQQTEPILFDRDYYLKKGFVPTLISLFRDYGEQYRAPVKNIPGFDRDFSKLGEFLVSKITSKNTIIICFENKAKLIRFREILKEYSIDLKGCESYFTGKNEVFGIVEPLRMGFEIPEKDLVLIGEENIWGKSLIRRKVKRVRKKIFDIFSELNEGDYVVHIDHGIGIYKGIKKVKVGITKKEYFHIKYAKNDELYVPIESADHIHKYIGKDKPTLYTLDGKRWKNTKGRVKRKVKDIAKDLIKLYSERMNTKGFEYSHDNDWQHELEASFSYEETEDQIRVMEEIKEDMQSAHPMDRLVCGDVGFGKTELAVRAAFKAVMNSKQVAIIAPTTILVEQHFRTFQERFRMFPVKIAHVSRMQKPSENREVLKKLRTHEIDLVIGTHKLLSSKISFKDLGLLIVDEEQRFGVSHKEKIKSMKKNIDVLTMTATPIPRTLNMALNGIRDVSLIETAPDNRLPIKTFVIPFSELVLKESIEREVQRGGQVYYLYNNIRNILMLKAKLEKMIPDVKFLVAHGQMDRKDLNAIMDDFLDKKGDVLITTTIIESGIDIPNVNTIIVENAHRFGLSQLYQLKGRVGRSERQAYAYLFYKKEQKLTESAVKRLQTLRENTDLGSGFKVAMKDLEIRGAGNVFGGEQHGFVDDIGFEMYCRILKEVVAEEKGEMQTEYKEIRFSIPVDAYIPEYFEKNRKKKIELYRKIAGVMNEKELKLIHDEIRDNYGNIPKEISNLLKIQNIKLLGRKVLLSEVMQYSKNTVILKFYKLEFTGEGLGDFLDRFSSIIDFSVNLENAVAIKVEKSNVSRLFSMIENVLQYIRFCVNIGIIK